MPRLVCLLRRRAHWAVKESNAPVVPWLDAVLVPEGLHVVLRAPLVPFLADLDGEEISHLRRLRHVDGTDVLRQDVDVRVLLRAECALSQLARDVWVALAERSVERGEHTGATPS